MNTIGCGQTARSLPSSRYHIGTKRACFRAPCIRLLPAALNGENPLRGAILRPRCPGAPRRRRRGESRGIDVPSEPETGTHRRSQGQFPEPWGTKRPFSGRRARQAATRTPQAAVLAVIAVYTARASPGQPPRPSPVRVHTLAFTSARNIRPLCRPRLGHGLINVRLSGLGRPLSGGNLTLQLGMSANGWKADLKFGSTGVR